MQTTAEPFLQDRLFWVRYLAAGVDFRGCETLARDGRLVDRPDLPDARVAFAFPWGFGLTLTLDGAGHRLALTHPSLTAPAALGWMDCQHMSDVLQQEEFEALVLHLDAQADPGREPWMARLLLGFYVSPLPEYGDWLPTLLGSAVSASGLFTAAEAGRVEAHTQSVARASFLWVFDRRRGWVARGEDAYSLRVRGNRDFPFALVRELFSAVGAG